VIDKKIGIIGCGNMGEALLNQLSGVLDKSTRIMVSELDAKRRDYIQTKYRIIVEIDNNRVVKFSDVIIIAVKPQDFDSVLKQEVCCGISASKIIISIAAGITTAYIENAVGRDIPVVRVMPNMPAVVGEAISAVSGGAAAGVREMELVREIFSLLGEVVLVEERFQDAVTAVSGSGPAYFFYLIEALIEAAESVGLDRNAAKRLVIKTALGSSRLLDALKEEPGILCKKVTSKGGTTEAALKVFESGMLKTIVKDAVREAARRSAELSRR
jgi:pyrroline-5-carboxylate reductase